MVVLSLLSYTVFSLAVAPELNFYENRHAPDYHPDEGVWIAAGKYYFEKYYLEGDWSHDTWSSNKFGGFGRRGPIMGKYVIGGWLFLQDKVDQGVDIPGYEFNQMDWEVVKNQRPPIDILNTARIPFKYLGILCTVLLFLLTRQLLGSWLLGSIVGIVFCLQPHVISFSQKAMNDMLALVMSMIALFLSARLINKIWSLNPNQGVPRFVLIGILLGLALLAKLYNLLVLGIIGLWLTLELVGFIRKFDSSTLKRTVVKNSLVVKILLGFIALTLIISTIWVLPNPYLHHHTIKNTVYLVGFGKKVKRNEAATEDQKNLTWSKRWQSLVRNGPGRSGIFHYWLAAPPLIDKTLAGLGIVGLFFIRYRFNRKADNMRNFSFLMVWLLIITAGTLVWTPFDWPRWYLPMSPIWAFLEGLGIFTLFVLVAFLSQVTLVRHKYR